MSNKTPVLFSLCIGLWAVGAQGQGVSHAWSQRFGDSELQLSYSCTVDAFENVIMVGHFEGTVDFGGGPLTSLGWTDIIVAKYDPLGNHVWSQRFGDAAQPQQAFDVATDTAGNIVVAGHFRGTVDFGGGPIVCNCTAGTYIVKFDPQGNHVWSHGYYDDYLGPRGLRIATDGGGNVVVTGFFAGTTDFGGGPLISAGSTDIYLAKLDSGGSHLWSQRFGDASWESANGLAIDSSGNILVTGEFPTTVDFGGGPMSCAGDFDIYLVKFTTYGAHLWSKRFGDVIDETGDDVSVDNSGNIFLTGYVAGPVDFGGGPITSAGFSDIYLAKFDSNGVHAWSQSFGDPGFQFVRSVATDPLGNVLITGDYSDTLDFGGGPLVANGTDTYIAQFDPQGTHLWSERFGEESSQYGTRLSVAGSGNVVLIGYFHGAIDLGGGILVGAGGADIFLAKFAATATGIEDKPAIPAASLDASPNPFNPSTVITYTVSQAGLVRLNIYDVRGHVLKTLVNESKHKGLHKTEWDGKDDDGAPAASGVYFACLHAGGKLAFQKLVLIK